jgi:hypothetical protein
VLLLHSDVVAFIVGGKRHGHTYTESIFPSQSSALMRFPSLSTTLDHKCNGTVRQSGAIC